MNRTFIYVILDSMGLLTRLIYIATAIRKNCNVVTLEPDISSSPLINMSGTKIFIGRSFYNIFHSIYTKSKPINIKLYSLFGDPDARCEDLL